MQNNPWDAFPATGAQPTPSNSGIIRPRVNPSKAAEERRDQIRTDIAIESNERDKEKFNVSQSDTNFNQANSLRKSFDQLKEVDRYKTIISSYATSINSDQTAEGDQLLINSYAQMLNPTSTVMLGEYQATEQNQAAIDSVIARLKREMKMDNAGRLLPAGRASIREEMQNIAERANEAYNLKRKEYSDLAQRYGFDPAEIIGPHLGDPFRPQIEQYRLGIYQDQRKEEQPASGPVPVAGYEDQIPPEFRGQVKEVLLDKGRVIGLSFLDESQPDLIFFDTKGGDDGSSLGSFVDGLGNVANSVTNPLYGAVQRAGMRPGYAERMISGLTLGSGDEFAGMGAAVARALQGGDIQEGYLSGRDSARFRNEVADQRTGFAGDAVEIGSSLLVPFGSARTVGRAALTGMSAGALGGFNYGEGTQNSLTNLALGAVAGGTIGAGAGWVGNQIASRSAANTERLVQQNDMLRAAGELDLQLPRAVTDPRLQNKTRAVASTMSGGNTIREGLEQSEQAIGQKLVEKAGQGGEILERPNAGRIAQEAFTRADKAKKAKVDATYEKYRQASGDPAVVPQKAIARLDETLAELKASPNTNKDEIADLEGLRADLANGNVTVERLRKIRTSWKEKFKAGQLSFSERETRLLDALDEAYGDIAAALDPKSPGYKLLTEANRLHGERKVFQRQLMADIIGKDRDLPLDAGNVFAKVMTWTNPRGDLAKLQALKSSMRPDEWRDFAATGLMSRSVDNNGNFSIAAMMKNIEQLERAGSATIKTMFGDDGAKALKNLKIVGEGQKRIQNAALGGQGSAQSNDYRSWLYTVIPSFVTGAAGAITNGAGTGAGLGVGMAATIGGGKILRDFFTAKSLMKPAVANWLATAPRTNNPAAINKHFEKLGAIAKAEPALAAEIDAFRNAIFSVANDNAQRAVAEDRQR